MSHGSITKGLLEVRQSMVAAGMTEKTAHLVVARKQGSKRQAEDKSILQRHTL